MVQERSVHRKDALRTREHLLDVIGELIEEHGPGFGIPDLARRSGVSAPTVYRHFKDVAAAIEAYQSRLVARLADALHAVPDEGAATERLWRMCDVWVAEGERWGAAAARVRPSTAVVARLRSGNPRTAKLYAALRPVVDALIEERAIPEQSADYVILMWFTLLDERLLLELRREFGWSHEVVVEQLFEALLAVCRASAAHLRIASPGQ